jgi:hypothetical protein
MSAADARYADECFAQMRAERGALPKVTRTEAAPALTLRVRGKSYPVTDYAEASRMVCEARDQAGIGNSDFPTPLIYEGGRQVAHVSYNGRVWPGLPTQWKAGDKPLYDNGAGLDR